MSINKTAVLGGLLLLKVKIIWVNALLSGAKGT